MGDLFLKESDNQQMDFRNSTDSKFLRRHYHNGQETGLPQSGNIQEGNEIVYISHKSQTWKCIIRDRELHKRNAQFNKNCTKSFWNNYIGDPHHKSGVQLKVGP